MYIIKRIKLYFQLRKELKECKKMITLREGYLKEAKSSFDWEMAVHCQNALDELKQKLGFLNSYKNRL